MISETEIRKAISLLKTENQLFEVRVIYNSKQMYSGYFKTADDLIKAFNKDIRDYANCNIYITLNQFSDVISIQSGYACRYIQEVQRYGR